MYCSKQMEIQSDYNWSSQRNFYNNDNMAANTNNTRELNLLKINIVKLLLKHYFVKHCCYVVYFFSLSGLLGHVCSCQSQSSKRWKRMSRSADTIFRASYSAEQTQTPPKSRGASDRCHLATKRCWMPYWLWFNGEPWSYSTI